MDAFCLIMGLGRRELRCLVDLHGLKWHNVKNATSFVYLVDVIFKLGNILCMYIVDMVNGYVC